MLAFGCTCNAHLPTMMHCFSCSAWSLVLLVGLGTVIANEDSGSVTFFPSPDFTGPAKRVFVGTSNACINVNCLEDAPRSIFWTNLDGDNTVNTDGGSIVFFSNADCRGPSVMFATHAEDSPATLVGTTVEKGIGSFAVRTGDTPLKPSANAVCADADLTADATRADSFSGTITFHQLPFRFGSATWSDMSPWSTLNSKKESQLYFYEDADCRGYQHRYAQTAQAFDFRLDRLSVVKSVMLEQYSPFSLTHKNVTLTINSTLVPVAPFSGTVTLTDKTTGKHQHIGPALALYRDMDCEAVLGSPQYTTDGTVDIDLQKHDVKAVQSFMLWVNYDFSNQTSAEARHIEARDYEFKHRKVKQKFMDCNHRWLHRFDYRRLCMDTDAALRDIRIEAEDVRVDAVVGQTDNAMIFRGSLHRHVVLVKKLRPELEKNESARETFLYEAKLASELTHLKILKFIGVYWTPRHEVGCVYEYAAVHDLISFLRLHRHILPWMTTPESDAAGLPTKLSIAIDVAEALVLLHSFLPPYPHGNLSVKSVVLTANGTAKLWNFRPADVNSVASQTTTSTWGSTREAHNDDIAAFGTLLLELDRCATGPFCPDFSSSCPEAVAELARKCWSEHPHKRPASTDLFFTLKRIGKGKW
ncbi:TPA: hypothetical protein N0F65_000707 [Lagenidium giganteum]|uniref:Protein kinase domain-containing protein n=1 Tax=Lagenidium giganteum TaxID=4803 RepID=A0AAV2ZHJ8_9STRA|nr:TPA: hypothetical protein N0F65_000707 [Lagenidium giganteum]